MATFDENGNYVKTTWKGGDKITAAKLNKIEESLEAINNNDISRHVETDARLDALESGTVDDKYSINAKVDALEDVVEANKDAADLEFYSINAHMTLLDKKIDDGVAEVEAIANTVDGKISAAETNMNNIANTVDGKISQAETNMQNQVNQGKADMEAMVAEVEGELNLLSIKTDDGFIHVDSIPGVVKYETEQAAYDNAYASDNHELVQEVLNSNKKIRFGKGYYPFLSPLSIQRDSTITSDGGILVFPESKGLVTDKIEYCSNVSVTDIEIHSKDNCIDFVNDGVTYPYNVYMSKFINLRLRSDEGHCLYGGDKQGYGGDQLCFDLKFENIKVNAPNGSGFYGFSGLMTFYERITDWGSIKNVFQNCTGIWRDCNTSFAGAEYFLLYDTNGRAHYSANIELYNVNMETVSKGGIYIESNMVAHVNVILENSSVTIKPTIVNGEVQKLNRHPLHLGLSITNLSVLNSKIGFEQGKTWSEVIDASIPQTLISVSGTNNINVTGNNIVLYDRSTNMVRTFNAITKINYPSVMPWYSEQYDKTNETHSFNFVGGRVQNFKTMSLTNSMIQLSNENETFDGIIIDSIGSTSNIDSIILKNKPIGQIFTIINKTNSDISIRSVDGYATKILLKSGTSKTLAPSSAISFLYQATGIGGVKMYMIEL